MIDFAARAWGFRAAREGGADVVIGENVAGADNHRTAGSAAHWYDLKLSLARAIIAAKRK
jgi:hypothetical protein